MAKILVIDPVPERDWFIRVEGTRLVRGGIPVTSMKVYDKGDDGAQA